MVTLPKKKRSVRAWRISKGLLQSELAEQIGCSQMTVSNAERRKPVARWVINKFVELGEGSLDRGDFTEQSLTRRKRRKNRHGSKSKARAR